MFATLILSGLEIIASVLIVLIDLFSMLLIPLSQLNPCSVASIMLSFYMCVAYIRTSHTLKHTHTNTYLLTHTHEHNISIHPLTLTPAILTHVYTHMRTKKCTQTHAHINIVRTHI